MMKQLLVISIGFVLAAGAARAADPASERIVLRHVTAQQILAVLPLQPGLPPAWRGLRFVTGPNGTSKQEVSPSFLRLVTADLDGKTLSLHGTVKQDAALRATITVLDSTMQTVKAHVDVLRFKLLPDGTWEMANLAPVDLQPELLVPYMQLIPHTIAAGNRSEGVIATVSLKVNADGTITVQGGLQVKLKGRTLGSGDHARRIRSGDTDVLAGVTPDADVESQRRVKEGRFPVAGRKTTAYYLRVHVQPA